MGSRGWIGVDLDGTLAHYDGWKGPNQIGAPIPAMVERVQQWIAHGHTVKIFTARVAERDAYKRDIVEMTISNWCAEHIGIVLPITNVKDYAMTELWDDRAVQVIPNTGMRADGGA